PISGGPPFGDLFGKADGGERRELRAAKEQPARQAPPERDVIQPEHQGRHAEKPNASEEGDVRPAAHLACRYAEGGGFAIGLRPASGMPAKRPPPAPGRAACAFFGGGPMWMI